MSGVSERERRTQASLSTFIRIDQAGFLHQIKIIEGRSKEDIVQEALDTYFEKKYSRRSGVATPRQNEGAQND
jgi:hypothetical protein